MSAARQIPLPLILPPQMSGAWRVLSTVSSIVNGELRSAKGRDNQTPLFYE